MDIKKRYGLIAGLSLIAMAIVAGYTYGYAHSSVYIHGNAEQTLANLQLNKGLFIVEIVGWTIIFVLDLIVAWTLYAFLRKVNQNLSVLSSFFRALYTGFLGYAIWQLVDIVPLINGSFADQIIIQFESFESVWSAGLIIFGVHLASLGILTFRAPFIPKIFGWLLLLAGSCYFCLNASKVLLAAYLNTIVQLEIILSLPMAIGELAFAIWLVFRAEKSKQLVKNDNTLRTTSHI